MPEKRERKAGSLQKRFGLPVFLTHGEGRRVGMKHACIGKQANTRGLRGVDDILVLGTAFAHGARRDQQQPIDALEGCRQDVGPRIICDADLDALRGELLGDVVISRSAPATMLLAGTRFRSSGVTRLPSWPVAPVTNSRGWLELAIYISFRVAEKVTG